MKISQAPIILPLDCNSKINNLFSTKGPAETKDSAGLFFAFFEAGRKSWKLEKKQK